MSFPMVALGEVIKHRNQFIQIDDLENYKRCRVQLHAKGIVLRDIISGTEIKTKKQQVCRTGDFLVAEIDAKIGGFGIVPSELDGSIVSSHYFLFIIDETRLDRRFLNFFIRTPYFREQVTAKGTTNYAAIRPADVLSYKIPLPPLAEQRRIVARVEELAAKIEEARGLRRKAGEEANIFLKNAQKKVFLKLTQNYQMMTLKDLGILLSGGTPSKFNSAYWNGNIPFVTGADVTDFLVKRSRAFLTMEGLNSGKTAICDKGTVLIVSRTGVGRVGIANERMGASQDITPFICNKSILPEYVTWNLISISDELIKNTRGTTIKGLLREYLEELKIPLPPLPEQHRIVAYLDALQAKVDALRRLQAETGAEMDALMPAVLDKAFKGEM